MNAKLKLEALLHFFDCNRQVGHTTAMIEGLKDFPGEVIVLAADEQHARWLQRQIPGRTVISTNTPERLLAIHAAAVLDNLTVMTIASESLAHIGRLEEELAKERRLLAAERAAHQETQSRALSWRATARKLAAVMESWRVTDWFNRRETSDPVGHIVVGIEGEMAISALMEFDQKEGSSLDVPAFPRSNNFRKQFAACRADGTAVSTAQGPFDCRAETGTCSTMHCPKIKAP